MGYIIRPILTATPFIIIRDVRFIHHNDVIMDVMASQINSLRIVYSTVYSVYSGADQRQYQSSASLAFVRGIHRWPVNSPHKWPVTRKIWWRHHAMHRVHWITPLRKDMNSRVQAWWLHNTVAGATAPLLRYAPLTGTLALCEGNPPVESPHKPRVFKATCVS